MTATTTTTSTDWPIGHRYRPGVTAPALWKWAWQHVGQTPRPVSTRELPGLLRLIGYDVDIEYATSVAAQGTLGRLPHNHRWDADMVCRLIDVLESERRWLPLHPFHRHKLTTTERRQHTQRAVATLETVTQLRQMPVDHLIGLLVDAEPRQARATVATILREQLETSSDANRADSGA